MEDRFAKPLQLLKQYGIVQGLLLVGLVIFIYGLIQFLGKSSSDDVTFQTQAQAEVTGSISPTETAEIVVDIEGAVVRPGVYHLNSAARLEALVTKAGGFVSSVDREKVAKGLNLAEKLTDGAKV